MKKHLYLLAYFFLILTLLFGTSLPSGTATTVDTAIANNTIPNVDEFSEVFNRIRLIINGADEPLVQQQEYQVLERMQILDGNPIYSASIAARAGRVPAISKSLEPEEIEKSQEVDEIKEDPEPEASPKTATPPADPKPTPQPKTVVQVRITVNGLNVRTGPSTQHDIIDVLNVGQAVDVISEENAWLQIKLPSGQSGWISSQYTAIVTKENKNGNGSLSGKIIIIDAGHGGTDPGAVGVTGLREKDVILDVSLRVADSLRAHGAKVILTRDTDIFIPLSQRVTIAETAGADLFVSIHANAHPDPKIGGIETYYFQNKASANKSSVLASLLQGELVKALGLRDIGVKHGNFLVIRQTSMPSVLLELGFLSNAREEERMRTSDFRQHAADAIVRGLQSYFR
jgi:N-acetylmuramoyl-L-alanine amidase